MTNGSDDVSRFHIPGNRGNSRDPVEQNPFKSDDTRHPVWAKATAAAEIELLQLEAELAREVVTLDDIASGRYTLLQWLVQPTARKFDIWAKRGLHVVWSDAEREYYDSWLVGYANAWLDELWRFLETHKPPYRFGNLDATLTEARNVLSERITFWQLQARDYRGRQTAAFEAARPRSLKDKRRTIVARYREAHDLTAEGLAMRARMSTTAVRALIDGNRRRYGKATEERFLKVIGVTEKEWDTL